MKHGHVIGQAPPPTRGSTPDEANRLDEINGSPAHAGIDPEAAFRQLVGIGLPRPRGDRPDSDIRSMPPQSAPPPTRGSTLGWKWVGNRLEGSPAHAGIDPTTRIPGGLIPRLPRPRGDRPFWIDMGGGKTLAPPPTRGSTPQNLRRVEVQGGSPAHAGIDPVDTELLACEGRLPRPRGDRPRLS